MKVNYYLLNPTGNMTILVETAVPVKNQPAVASRIMELEPTAEQVGFVNGNCLRMAGGEFCGNATLSAAALYFNKIGLNVGGTASVDMTVSGVEKSVNVKITAKGNEEFTGEVSMPLPFSVKSEELEFNEKSFLIPSINFGGVVHLIVENPDCDKSFYENAVKKWCDDLHTPALGIMLLNEEKSELKPLVYARDANTLFWESSCASGTSAVGAYLAHKNKKPVSVKLNEPGGTLCVFADESKIILSGKVKVEKYTEIEI